MAINVDLVSVERMIWSGEATMVIARTTEGELGVLPGHAPLFGQLSDIGTVRIQREGDQELVAAVHGGFISITAKGVSVLAELAELSDEIDVERAQRAYDDASGRDDDAARADLARATSRLRASGRDI